MSDKYCINCTHFKPAGQVTPVSACLREAKYFRDLIYGEKIFLEDTVYACCTERTSTGGCGIEGRFYVEGRAAQAK